MKKNDSGKKERRPSIFSRNILEIERKFKNKECEKISEEDESGSSLTPRENTKLRAKKRASRLISEMGESADSNVSIARLRYQKGLEGATDEKTQVNS